MAQSKKGNRKNMSYGIGKNIRITHPLKKEIYKRGYTIIEFAELSNINRWTLNNIFKGNVPRGDTIYQISKGLKTPYEEVEGLCQV